jgi:hypothetical protein
MTTATGHETAIEDALAIAHVSVALRNVVREPRVAV